MDTDSGYSRTNPATLTLRCDKAKCKGKGVSSYTARISLLATGDRWRALRRARSRVRSREPSTRMPVEFCTDYVSSKRDNAGDLLLRVLFFRDLRA